MANNAEYIRLLDNAAARCRLEGDGPTCNALGAAIRALRAEGRSSWRKVGKRHPGKRWEHARVIVALANGCRSATIMPSRQDWEEKGIWTGDFSRVTHWQPWPEHLEKEVKR